ncbi:MAG: GTPase ObgE [Kiritimatiellaeota bacterium]|nr:GTPase ObgE [Kiritimatiellota bacterium]
MKSRRFIDTVPLPVRAGKGGDGVCSFRREKFVPRGGPDGGDGGHGGSVILRGDEDVDSLIALFFNPKLIAENGGKGAGRKMHGKNGKDLVVPVPLGTLVTDTETGETLGDVTRDGQTLLLAKGGKGGLGNVHWKSSVRQAPFEYTEGTPGEELNVRLDLRMMADAGLVGFPSAGKSSLLRAITAARPKVAAYPFTTLNPIIGTLAYPEANASLRVADIPGLIEGAHHGVGLGHNFLRHIERSRVLIYVIDMAGVDNRKPWDDYATLRSELALHDPALLKRPSILIANKMDLPAAKENVKAFRAETRKRPLLFSAERGLGVEKLVQRLFTLIVKGTQAEAPLNRPSSLVPRPSKDERRQTKDDRRQTKDERRAPPRKGYTPPRPLSSPGENPLDDGTEITAAKLSHASFLKTP